MNDQTQSSPFTGVPSENFTPGLRLNVYTSPFLLIFQSVARQGMMDVPSWLTVTSPS